MIVKEKCYCKLTLFIERNFKSKLLKIETYLGFKVAIKDYYFIIRYESY